MATSNRDAGTPHAGFSLKKHVAGAPLFVIAGPCVIDDRDLCLHIGRTVAEIGARLGLPMIFKASFDKANRTAGTGFRGPGLREGLEILAEVGRTTGLPLLTDIHQPEQAEPVSEVCQVLQIPAFLCRQTDLVEAAARAAPVVNIKKGQFLAPWNTKTLVEKARRAAPGVEVLLTERGTSFGYGSLIVDMRSFPIMAPFADAVIFDATHSLQLPGAAAGGDRTGGQREFIPTLLRAAVATGTVDGLFLEVHPEPAKSPSDADNIWPLDRLEDLLREALAVRRVVLQPVR
jgi:2-dehydro-3-deoxyphosphooctonate aldolase (KDO 8-P synthase)